jgi:cell division protein FtsQ
VAVQRGSVQDRRWKLVRARREAVPTSVRRMHQRRFRRPTLRWLRPVLWGALAAVVMGLGAWLVYGTSVLGVQAVEVSGSMLASPDQVRAAAAVIEGTPLAQVDTDQVAARVRTLPSVAAVEVSRSWPHTLVIEVVERTPVGVVAVEGGFAVLDGAGVVFNQVPAQPAGVVLLRLAAPGPDDPATTAALRVLASLTPALRDGLAEVDAPSPTRIRLQLADGRVVVWGDADRSAAKATVATALLATDATTIDVSVPDVATTS